MQEIWKDIKGYEELYQISNLGNVKSLKRKTLGKKHGNHYLKERILKPGKSGNYYHVCLRKNNVNKIFYIHRLVAQTFIKNIENKNQVNHKNGKTTDNNVNNLEWVTASENQTHAYKVLKRKTNIQNFEKYRTQRKRKINQYDKTGNFIKSWDCISDAEKFLNAKSIGKICECCQHKNGRKSAFGFKWEYANTEIPQ